MKEESAVIATLRKDAITRLQQAGIESPALEADLLLACTLNCSRMWILTHADEVLTTQQQEQLQEILDRRCLQEPIQYILGVTEFMGLRFQVTPAVLIPRQDTEILVEAARDWIGTKKLKLLDLCTGSGCIALSLLHYCPQLQATATDLSSAALEIAKANAQALGLGERTVLYQGDLWDALPEGQRFDVLCSNPPYIPRAVVKELHPQVRSHEPNMALDGGEDGLLFYRRILQKAPFYLEEGGKLFLEIGYDQEEAVRTLAREAGFQEIRCLRDLGGNARVILAS